MKKMIILCSLLLLTSIAWQANAQAYTPAFAISPDHPKPGSTCTITYKDKGTILEGKKNIRGIVYSFNNFAWKAEDLSLVWKDTAWTGTYQLQPGAALLSCIFQADTIIDNGGKMTYAWLLSGTNGKQMPGAFYAWGTLRNPNYSRKAPYKADTASYINDEITRMWFRYEARDNPAAKPFFFKEALTLYKKIGTDSAMDDNIRKELAGILSMPNLSEQAWMDAQEVFQNVLRDKAAADSLEKIILAKYPKGIVARDKVIYTVTREADLDKKNKAIEQMLVDFPPVQFQQVQTITTDLYYSKLFRSLVYTPIMKDSNYSYLYKYLSMAPTDALSTFYHHMVEIPHEQKKMPLPVLLRLSDTIYNEIMRRPADGIYSPLQWKEEGYRINAFVFYTHATVLFESNQPAKALAVAEMVKHLYNYKKADFNDLYVRLLIANKKKTAVNPYLLASAKENALSPYMLDLLKKDYVARNKNNKGFDTWLDGLKSKEQIAAHESKLKADLINQSIVPFNLESAKGGMVDLAKMKGKIVVLDFWATWCAPCKAAMPGMQLAVNKFRNDKNVSFYFVATQETKANYKEEINKFLAAKKYTFEVLYDGLNKETQHLDEAYAQYAKDYQVSGIPMKMIIDQQGKLRWLNTGYMGSPSALADEIAFIIETLKKEEATGTTGTATTGAIRSTPVTNSNSSTTGTATPAVTTATKANSTGAANNTTTIGTNTPTYDAQTTAALTTPHPYKTEDVTFSNADNSIRFAGTLTQPVSGSAAKAVILVSGTGKQDRDGTMAGHKMFAVIADHLTRNGVAVLRVDDRGTGLTTGQYENATTEDFANDALLAVTYLQSRADMKNTVIGLLGHSEGGAAIAIAAAQSKDVAFIISLSGLASKGLDALLEQNKQLVEAAPIPQLNKDRFNEIDELMFTTVYKHANDSTLEKTIRDTYAVWKAKDNKLVDSLKIQYDHFRFPIESYVRQATGPWYRYHIRFDPAPFMARIQVPVLAIHGDKDIMLNAADNLANWKKYTTSNPNRTTTQLLPGLNHLLQTCTTCTPQEYPQIPETIAPIVLLSVTNWLKS